MVVVQFWSSRSTYKWSPCMVQRFWNRSSAHRATRTVHVPGSADKRSEIWGHVSPTTSASKSALRMSASTCSIDLPTTATVDMRLIQLSLSQASVNKTWEVGVLRHVLDWPAHLEHPQRYRGSLQRKQPIQHLSSLGRADFASGFVAERSTLFPSAKLSVLPRSLSLRRGTNPPEFGHTLSQISFTVTLHALAIVHVIMLAWMLRPSQIYPYLADVLRLCQGSATESNGVGVYQSGPTPRGLPPAPAISGAVPA